MSFSLFCCHSVIYVHILVAVKGYRADRLSVRAVHVFRQKCFSPGMWLVACVCKWQLVSGFSLTAEGLLLMLQVNPTQPHTVHFLVPYMTLSLNKALIERERER